MHEVLVNRLGGLSLPRKSVVRLTDLPDMTLDVYRGRKTTIQPTNPRPLSFGLNLGVSTDGSDEDLSQTGSYTSVRTSLRKYTHSKYYMPRVIKYLKKEAKLMGLKPMGKDSEPKQRCGCSSRMTSGLT